MENCCLGKGNKLCDTWRHHTWCMATFTPRGAIGNKCKQKNNLGQTTISTTCPETCWYKTSDLTILNARSVFHVEGTFVPHLVESKERIIQQCFKYYIITFGYTWKEYIKWI